MQLDSDSYDVIVLGTGLAESIAAAALAKTGRTVLHLDPNAWYGGEQASLTLDELASWAQRAGDAGSEPCPAPVPTATSSAPATAPGTPTKAQTQVHTSASLSDPTTSSPSPSPGPAHSLSSPSPAHSLSSRSSRSHSRYSHARTTPLSPALAADQRRYALSLFPALMPARGALVQTLIASDVSKYVAFRLLDGVHIWEDGEAAAASAAASEVETAVTAPGAAATAATGEANQGAHTGEPATPPTTSEMPAPAPAPTSVGTTRRVPGSKESVFKDKSISLPDKRRLMKALLFAGGEFEDSELFQGHASDPLLPFLETTLSLPPRLASAVAYAVAHSDAHEPAGPALARARRYLQSMGRYGPSAFLVGQYGGAGEVAQGFCRACAVFGGVYVLGPEAAVSDIREDEGGVSLSVPAHPTRVRARHLIASPALLNTDKQGKTTTTARAVAVLTTRPPVLAAEGEDDDTAVVVFPGSPAVRALIMGEGTGSCPASQWVAYLWSEAASDTDPDALLAPYLARLGADVAFKATYLEHREETPPAPNTDAAASPSSPIVRLAPYAGPHTLTEGLDWEAEQAAHAFRAVVGDDTVFFDKEQEDAGEDEE